MLLNLWHFFAIQERQQIAEPGVADQKFEPCYSSSGRAVRASMRSLDDGESGARARLASRNLDLGLCDSVATSM